MKKISCIAIDDEPLALLIIEKFCERKGNLELTTFSEPSVGLEAIQKQRPEIVFLDIEMNGINGLTIAHSLPSECCLIFTTAHAQYALDGFNLNAIDFLYKPFSYERFERAVEKALKEINNTARKEMRTETIVVKQEYNNVSVPLSDIIYIEALGNYCKIVRTDEKILSRTNMKAMDSLLPDNLFIRIHRSYIVSIQHIESFTKKQVKLKSIKKVLPIGQQYASNIKERICAQRFSSNEKESL